MYSRIETTATALLEYGINIVTDMIEKTEVLLESSICGIIKKIVVRVSIQNKRIRVRQDMVSTGNVEYI